MKKVFLYLVLSLSVSVLAQQKVDLSYYLPSDVSYDKNIPTPKSIIGHEVGEWHITHDKLVSYMKALAKASNRVTIENRGETYEGRPLLLLTITAPKNHQNLEEIREKHIEITDNASINVSNQPIVVYQGFSIHGNEPSGSNAALAAAYYLAAAQGPKINELLNNTVILFDPSLNPDGLQRFAYWANTNKASNINPDTNDREYHEVWPGGRTNHYWFDMNRDWLPVQLPESTARIKTFHKWLPNILTDHHEMGTNSTFFFQPGIPSRTNPLTPQMNQDLTREIATYHAKAFDKIGSTYYSEESFDDFYYGKGSTFPDINGSIGILFEQGSSRGHAQESDNGILTFPFTIRNQFTATLSTLEAAKNMREKILKYQQGFYEESRKLSENKAFVFGDEKDAIKSYHLAEVLKKHKVKLHELKSDLTVNGKYFKKGYSYAVPMNQKNNRLVKAMFDVRTTFKDSLFYDVSAWTFNHAFGVDFAKNVSLSKVGNEILDLKKKSGSIQNKSTVGYLFAWNEYEAPKALNEILEKGLRAKVAMKQFKNNNKPYDYGTIFIPAQNQKLNNAELFAYLEKVAMKNHIEITGVSTGLNDGIDLGSRNFRVVKEPKVAMLVGKGITSYDAGEIWHLLDQRFDMKLTKLDMSYASRVNLSKYTTIIIPNSYSIDKNLEGKLRDWVRKGGVLIGYRNAVNWMSKKGFISLQFNKPKMDTVKNVSFENRSLQSGAQVIGGAIFEALLDRSHPISFGYKNNKIALFRNTRQFIQPDKKSYNNPIQYTNAPLLSGYISKENLKELKNTVPFKSQRLGAGKVIVFTDNTNFRGFWFGTNKLLMNAIFFGRLM
ncbi:MULTISPECIES: M14 family metallopeptidase [unclassified Tenacibaculum]|uniref:M14 family metallopeptidase n=1 Tax=unclassified Tenacibaculum TaxID=2635139 RepID=UPI001F17B799|nr:MULTISPECIES: M14 family metallopeptidase [unclassified Tenacibaculum]MCF2876244.1 M14 family metallopeptidase [Tenacibaculum sp. Cn5-1]MCF2936319.1 M14 family metallopeptidase [Tenacibaculum sp. Cn5-34]MCG7511662.1 M14 family metallopeptidase [Tenacibaculum sp. Cn5-46]